MIFIVDRSKNIDEQIEGMFGPRGAVLISKTGEVIGFEDWHVWQGSENSDGKTGERDEDVRSLIVSALDLNGLYFASFRERFPARVRSDEISSEEYREMLRADGDKILLDAQIGFSLWYESGHRSLNYMKDVYGAKYIEFYGTVFHRHESVGPVRYVFVIFWLDDKHGWKWYYKPLSNIFSAPNVVVYIKPPD